MVQHCGHRNARPGIQCCVPAVVLAQNSAWLDPPLFYTSIASSLTPPFDGLHVGITGDGLQVGAKPDRPSFLVTHGTMSSIYIS